MIRTVLKGATEDLHVYYQGGNIEKMGLRGEGYRASNQEINTRSIQTRPTYNERVRDTSNGNDSSSEFISSKRETGQGRLVRGGDVALVRGRVASIGDLSSDRASFESTLEYISENRRVARFVNREEKSGTYEKNVKIVRNFVNETLNDPDISPRAKLANVAMVMKELSNQEALRDELQTTHVQGLDTSGNGRGNSEFNTTTRRVGSSKGYSTGYSANNEQVSGYATSAKGAEIGTNQPRNSTRNGSSGIPSQQTGVHSQRLEQHSMAPELQNVSRNRETGAVRGLSKLQVEHGGRGRQELFTRLWNSAKDTINQLTFDDLIIEEGKSHSNAFITIKYEIDQLLKYDRITMTDKMQISKISIYIFMLVS